MRYVYLLQSEAFTGQRYVGVTANLRMRLAEHNAGRSPHTSKYDALLKTILPPNA
jgi:putative endonuclease